MDSGACGIPKESEEKSIICVEEWNRCAVCSTPPKKSEEQLGTSKGHMEGGSSKYE